jgi:hypothetical protein
MTTEGLSGIVLTVSKLNDSYPRGNEALRSLLDLAETTKRLTRRSAARAKKCLQVSLVRSPLPNRD